jgi:hypothetical protein
MDIVFRAFFVFVLLYVLMRVIGRRELSTLEPFDLILLVVLGDLVQQGVTQDDYSVTGIMLAIGTIALLQPAVLPWWTGHLLHHPVKLAMPWWMPIGTAVSFLVCVAGGPTRPREVTPAPSGRGFEVVRT